MGESKTCESCGKTIVRRMHTSPADWAKKRFCSGSCARKKVHAPILPKQCEVCGVTFRKADTCSIEAWLARRYCSNHCALLARHNPGIKTEPHIDCNTCECGNPATKTVHFRTLTPADIAVAQQMRVCTDCYDYMITYDKGAW